MNWIDFNILSVGSKKPAVYNNEFFDIDIMNYNANKSVKCYVEHWDILNHIKGIWYELWCKHTEDDFIINSTWEVPNEKMGYRLYIDDKYKKIIENILIFYIDNSPIKKIIILFRHQGHEYEQITSTISLSDFMNKLLNKDIYGNVAYVLTK